MGLTPGSGRSPGGGHGTPLPCSCLGEAHGQRSLAGPGPWSRQDSDGTEVRQQARGSSAVVHGLVAPHHVESFWTSGATYGSCVGGQIPILCTTREVPFFAVLMDVSK